MKRLAWVCLAIGLLSSALAADPSEKITQISLYSSTYWGSRPDYDVLLCRDGMALYVGKARVERVGTYRGVIREDTFQSLADQFQKQGFFSLKKDYTAGAADPSSLSIGVVREGGIKIVTADHERGMLDSFEKAIQAAVAQIDWRKYDGPEEPTLEMLAEKLRGAPKPFKPPKKSPISGPRGPGS
jgi:uncharacterized protein DUF6438